MTTMTVFHGTQQERYELTVAIEHNCVCHIDPDTGLRTSTCPAHAMLLDQRILDGLDVTRRRAAALLAKELSESTHESVLPPYRMRVPVGPDAPSRSEP